jgi:hypothetical protein
MPNLKTSLSNLDPGFLTILADFWGIEKTDINPALLINQLIEIMSNTDQFSNMFDSLPNQSQEAINALAKNQGKMTWVEFSRRYGNLMEIGQAKLEREKKYLKKDSTTEYLWYRGFIFRAFFDEGKEPLEYIYLPDEFVRMRKTALAEALPRIFGKPFTIQKTETRVIIANDRILDHACTLLAALRAGLDLDKACSFNLPTNHLVELLKSAGLLTDLRQPKTEQTRLFLEADRSQAISKLFHAWERSDVLNELWLIPEIKCEGKWKNRPQAARQNLLELIKRIPGGEWWDLDDFIANIHEHQPDFLRPSGDYDSWIIRNRSSGEYLRGFANWDKVEGRLIQAILTKWLHWLGAVDLAFHESRQTICAFRLSSWSKYLFNNKLIPNLEKEKEKIIIHSNGSIICPQLTPRTVRYQIARFCEWGESKQTEFHYYLSAFTLHMAEAQKLKINQLVTLIQKNAKPPIPPTFLKAMARWEQFRLQAKFEQGVLLRVTEPSILDELEKNQARRFIIERVNPQLVLIKPGGQKIIQRTLMELGYLSENQSSL